mgnify:CR=1 FL=1
MIQADQGYSILPDVFAPAEVSAVTWGLIGSISKFMSGEGLSARYGGHHAASALADAASMPTGLRREHILSTSMQAGNGTTG